MTSNSSRAMGNPLSASSLALFMAKSLPTDASPQIKTPYDAIALAAHAAMIAVGFRLVGLGEDHKIEASSEAAAPHALPAEWNTSSSYAFRYAHDQSSMEHLVKVNRLGKKAVILAIGLGDDKTASFEVVAQDYISESNLPATPLTSASDEAVEPAIQTIQNVFISPGRLSDLGSLFKISVIQKLAPGIRKEGYEESASSSTTAADDSRRGQQQPPPRMGPDDIPPHDPLRDDPIDPRPARPRPFDDALADPPPRHPLPAGDFPPPGFEDELEVHRPPRGGAPLRSPLAGGYGDADLYPAGLGPRDPMTWGGVGGIMGGGSGGGMHPTFDDPLFAGSGGRGRGGLQAPPGARYDPVDPGDEVQDSRGIPRFPGGGLGGGFGGGMGGRPPNPFGGFGGNDFI